MVVVGNKNFCSLRDAAWQKRWARSLSSVVRGFKIGVTKWCRENGYENFKWQKSFYDHIIRDEKSLDGIREYIMNNPLKWELDRYNNENLCVF
jgi:REP element-mobilizing transposase RayT